MRLNINIVAAILLLALGQGGLYGAEKYLVTARVGDVIDQYERDYFNLFPHIQEYISGTVDKKSEDEYEITIRYRSGDEVQSHKFAADRQQIKNMEYYINNYECFQYEPESYEIFITGNFFNTNLAERVRGYLKKPEVTVTVRDGSKIRAHLLYATDDFLIMWQGRNCYYWDEVKELIKFIPYQSIETIDHEKGIPIHGNKELFLRQTAFLKDLSEFVPTNGNTQVILPPELDLMYSQMKKAVAKLTFPKSKTIEELEEEYLKNYHFYFNLGMNISFGNYASSIVKRDGVPEKMEPIEEGSIMNSSITAGIEYTLTEKIWLGLSASVLPDNREMESEGLFFKGLTGTIYGKYILMGYNPFSSNVADNFELSVTAGLTMNSITATSGYVVKIKDESLNLPQTINREANDVVFGLTIGGGAEYYFIHTFSAGLTVNYNLMPSFDNVRTDIRSNYEGSEWEQSMTPRELNFSALRAELGIRFHF